MKKELLHKPNQLISILPKKSLSLIQQKSFNIFLRNAQQMIKFTDAEKYIKINEDKRYKFEISCNQLHQQAGLKVKDVEYIKSELEKLMEIIISVEDKENKKNWSVFHLLEKVEKIDGIYKYFLDGFIVNALKENNFFTSLNLMQIKKLKSKYSLVFYELAIRYKKLKIPKMSIDKIRELTNTQNLYSSMKDFRKRVLDKACEEISEKTDIILSYKKPEKNGRRIAYIDFIIEEKINENFEDLKELESIKDLKNIEKIKVINYSEEVLNLYKVLPIEDQLETRKKQLEKLLKEHSYEMLEADIKYCKKNSKKNFWGYFVKSINSGHYSTIEVEKEKAKEELVKKQKILEEHKKELKKQEKIFLEEQAKEMFENISENELNNYEKEYKKQEKILKRVGVNLESFIISEIKYKLEEKI